MESNGDFALDIKSELLENLHEEDDGIDPSLPDNIKKALKKLNLEDDKALINHMHERKALMDKLEHDPKFNEEYIKSQATKKTEIEQQVFEKLNELTPATFEGLKSEKIDDLVINANDDNTTKVLSLLKGTTINKLVININPTYNYYNKE